MQLTTAAPVLSHLVVAVAFSDREDNSDEELSDEEEEDEEDSDEEDSDEQDTKMPAKTPKTPLKAKAPAAAAAESVTSAMASMTVSGFKPYSMSFQ